jgi:hypothetical protein
MREPSECTDIIASPRAWRKNPPDINLLGNQDFVDSSGEAAFGASAGPRRDDGELLAPSIEAAGSKLKVGQWSRFKFQT